MDGGNLPADPWWYPDDYPGEVAAIANANSGLGGHYSTDDMFELVWQGGGGGTIGQPAFYRLRSSQSPAIPPPPPPPLPSENMPLDKPPSEDVMAAWMSAIVGGQDHDGDGSKKPMMKEASEMIGSSRTIMTKRKGKLPTSEGLSGSMDTSTRSDSSEKKTSGSGSSNRKESSHHSVTHNTTEKKRRCRITERLRTLQQLVPGCDKSNNQTSTLEQTIQYMKSLQQQVQPMNTSPASPAAMYLFATPMPSTVAAVAPGTATPHAGIVPMVPYAHYHAVMMAAAAAAAPWYPPAPAGASSAARDATGGHLQCSVSLEQQQHEHKGGGGERDRDMNGSREPGLANNQKAGNSWISSPKYSFL